MSDVKVALITAGGSGMGADSARIGRWWGQGWYPVVIWQG